MTLHILYHLIRADFFERTRRFSFLVMLGLVVYLGFLVNDGSIGVTLGKYRGEYNSAWVGAMMSIVATFFLSWFGFFLVKNSIQRDQATGVGQIIATTPLGKLSYIAGKTLSNFVVLSIMVVILVLAALPLLLFKGIQSDFNLWQFVSPFLLLTLPALAVVAALAVFFESIPFLQGSIGNVVFFFGWMFVMIAGMEYKSELFDVGAMLIISESMKATAHAAFADYGGGFVLGNPGQPISGTFQWNGISWTSHLLLLRLMWVGIALVVVGLAALVFHRFDTSSEKFTLSKNRTREPKRDEEATVSATPVTATPHFQLTTLPLQFGFGKMVLAELRLMLKGMPWWWYTVAFILMIVCFTVPLGEARQFALPVAWIWPLLLWSSMGTRENQFRTHELVRSASRSLRRQLPSLWLAGVFIAMLTGSGVFVRLFFEGDTTGAAMWVVSVTFIPSLALAAGVWSGSSRLFEVLYMALWYVGPMSKTPELDFIGAAGVRAIPILPLICAGITIALCIAAYVGRRRVLER